MDLNDSSQGKVNPPLGDPLCTPHRCVPLGRVLSVDARDEVDDKAVEVRHVLPGGPRWVGDLYQDQLPTPLGVHVQ